MLMFNIYIWSTACINKNGILSIEMSEEKTKQLKVKFDWNVILWWFQPKLTTEENPHHNGTTMILGEGFLQTVIWLDSVENSSHQILLSWWPSSHPSCMPWYNNVFVMLNSFTFYKWVDCSPPPFNPHLHRKPLRIQICPWKGISPIFLFWGWDWDHQSYSRERSGFLGNN